MYKSWKIWNKLGIAMVLLILCISTVQGMEYDNIKTDTVCFNSEYNGIAYNISGTIFYKSLKPSNLIIAVHGFVNDRSVWDGGFFGHDENSYARTLANAGYIVLTYDRLGYGQSKINSPGAGFTIDSEVQLQNLRDIIIQIKDGSNSCSSTTNFRFDKIILVGHSGGSAIIESYSAQYHDVAAIIPMTPPGFGMNAKYYNAAIINWIIPQIYAGNDYVTMFPPGSNGLSQDCLYFFFDPKNTNPKISNTYCSNKNLIPSPSGEYLSAQDFWENTLMLVPQIEEDLPVLLVFADNDLLFNESQSADIAYWKQYCKCDLSILHTKTGHMLMFHKSSKDIIEYIIDWLHGNDLR